MVLWSIYSDISIVISDDSSGLCLGYKVFLLNFWIKIPSCMEFNN